MPTIITITSVTTIITTMTSMWSVRIISMLSLVQQDPVSTHAYKRGRTKNVGVSMVSFQNFKFVFAA